MSENEVKIVFSDFCIQFYSFDVSFAESNDMEYLIAINHHHHNQVQSESEEIVTEDSSNSVTPQVTKKNVP